MRKVTLRSLLGHKLQLGLTVLAIALGVALVSGTLVLTSAMTAGSAVLPSVSQADVVVRGGPLEALPTIPGGQPSLRHPLPASVADRVAGLDGVAAVRRVASGPLSLLGQDGQPLGAGGDAALGTSLTDVPGLPAQVRLADGRLPASGEAVVDATTVREHRYAIGEDIQVVGADGRAEALTLTGTLQPGELPGRMVGLDLPTAQRLLGRSGQLDELQVAAAPGLRSGVLRDRVGAFAGSDYQVLTGVDLQAQRQEAIQAGVRSVGQTMVWFVIVSLLIGAFLIANAFTIMIAQRTHELALLRCLGATVPQIRNAVLGEALVIGVAGSALGTLLGPLVAAALAQQFSRLGGGVAADANLGDLLDVAPLTVLGSMAVGVLVTVASALLPARKATAVAPLTAMREEGPGLAAQRVSRTRVAVGLVVTAAGGGILATGLARFEGALVGGGGLLFLVGVAVLAVPVARPLARLIGTPVARLTGLPGKLGRDNAMRSPRRTAATASALMIGLAMIVTMTVITASQRATAGEALRALGAGYQIAGGNQPASGDPFGAPDGPGVSRALLDELAGQPEVTGITGKWPLTATLTAAPGSPGVPPSIPVDAVLDPVAYQRLAGLRVEAGDMDGDGVAVRQDWADDLGVSLGSRLWVEIPDVDPGRLTVTAVFHDAPGHTSPLVVALDSVAEAVPHAGVPVAYVEVDAGPSPAAEAALESATGGYPALAVRDQAEQLRMQDSQVNQVLYLMYALLGLAVVIGLLGIVNTLALSVVGRVREVGLLRALGMDRRQVRAMIRGEAMIIALLGALPGIAIGVLFGWAVTTRLLQLPSFALPVAQLAALAVIAAVAGVAAAVLPGRWAPRVDVLRATAAQ